MATIVPHPLILRQTAPAPLRLDVSIYSSGGEIRPLDSNAFAIQIKNLADEALVVAWPPITCVDKADISSVVWASSNAGKRQPESTPLLIVVRFSGPSGDRPRIARTGPAIDTEENIKPTEALWRNVEIERGYFRNGEFAATVELYKSEQLVATSRRIVFKYKE